MVPSQDSLIDEPPLPEINISEFMKESHEDKNSNSIEKLADGVMHELAPGVREVELKEEGDASARGTLNPDAIRAITPSSHHGDTEGKPHQGIVGETPIGPESLLQTSLTLAIASSFS